MSLWCFASWLCILTGLGFSFVLWVFSFEAGARRGTLSSAILRPQPGNECILLLSRLFGVPASELGQGLHLLNLKTIEQCAVCCSAASLMLRCSDSLGKEVGFHPDYQNFKSTWELGTQEDDLGSCFSSMTSTKKERDLWWGITLTLSCKGLEVCDMSLFSWSWMTAMFILEKLSSSYQSLCNDPEYLFGGITDMSYFHGNLSRAKCNTSTGWDQTKKSVLKLENCHFQLLFYKASNKKLWQNKL